MTRPLADASRPQRPPTPQERETLAAMAAAGDEPLAALALATALRMEPSAARERLLRLTAKGFVERRKRQGGSVEWRITAAGQAALGIDPPPPPPPLPALQRPERAPRLTPMLEATLAALAAMPNGGKTAAVATAAATFLSVARERLLRLERLGLVVREERPRGARVDLWWQVLPAALARLRQGNADQVRAEAEIWLGRFGGAAAIGRLLGIDRTTVEKWPDQGIPEKWRQALEARYDGAMIEAELDRRLAATAAGTAIEYWRGALAIDAEATDRPDIMRHARAAQAWARRHGSGDRPAVTLTQIRHGDGDYAYLAVKLARSLDHAA